MAEDPLKTSQLKIWVKQLRVGKKSAMDELIQSACGRLELLTRKMLHNDPRVHRWEQTGDVLQSVFMRLWRALQDITPNSTLEFYRLSTTQIRRELIDLARHYYGPQGMGAHHVSDAGHHARETPFDGSRDTTIDPSRLAEWTEFHTAAGKLPEKERVVFDLYYYQGMDQQEIAKELNIDVSTVQRHWRMAKLQLAKALKRNMPGE